MGDRIYPHVLHGLRLVYMCMFWLGTCGYMIQSFIINKWIIMMPRPLVCINHNRWTTSTNALLISFMHSSQALTEVTSVLCLAVCMEWTPGLQLGVKRICFGVSVHNTLVIIHVTLHDSAFWLVECTGHAPWAMNNPRFTPWRKVLC